MFFQDIGVETNGAFMLTVCNFYAANVVIEISIRLYIQVQILKHVTHLRYQKYINCICTRFVIYIHGMYYNTDWRRCDSLGYHLLTGISYNSIGIMPWIGNYIHLNQNDSSMP